MNLGTIIGLILGLGLMGLAAFMNANTTGVGITALYDTVSILIVFGGSLAATAIAFKLSKVLGLFKLLKMIFTDDNFGFEEIDNLLNAPQRENRHPI